MAHEDILSDGLSYVDNLSLVPRQTPTVSPTSNFWDDTVTALQNAISGSGQAAFLNGFFASLNNSTNKLPTTYDAFITKLSSYCVANGRTLTTTAISDAF